ncbi:DUF2974 domain-containing protein [Streptobacillus felis]|uniref:DUF2974 domain-containing protein n=1 Tax=Streptobacillus felis TaxID=1384509 RepID=A0A7Z0PG58_9FUSO|nr:DUF2974 domain-containing protein [Streptobacillus felis]
MKDEKNGLDGYILENKNTGEIIISFRGTEKTKINDIKNDIQLSERNNDQYLEAYKQVKEYLESSKNKGKVALLVGHSLGGGIANYISRRLINTQAVTFDPAPVVYDSVIKNEIKGRERVGYDTSGDRDSLAVIPLSALLNGTTISKGKLTTNNKTANFASDLMHYDLMINILLKSIRKFYPENSKYMIETAYQNSKNANLINRKIRKELLEKHPDINHYLELLQRRNWFLSSKTTEYKAIGLEKQIKEYEKKDYIKKYNEAIVGITQNHQVGKVDKNANKLVKRKQKVGK